MAEVSRVGFQREIREGALWRKEMCRRYGVKDNHAVKESLVDEVRELARDRPELWRSYAVQASRICPLTFKEAVEAATVQLEAACMIGNWRKIPFECLRKGLEDLIDFLEGKRDIAKADITQAQNHGHDRSLLVTSHSYFSDKSESPIARERKRLLANSPYKEKPKSHLLLPDIHSRKNSKKSTEGERKSRQKGIQQGDRRRPPAEGDRKKKVAEERSYAEANSSRNGTLYSAEMFKYEDYLKQKSATPGLTQLNGVLVRAEEENPEPRVTEKQMLKSVAAAQRRIKNSCCRNSCVNGEDPHVRIPDSVEAGESGAKEYLESTQLPTLLQKDSTTTKEKEGTSSCRQISSANKDNSAQEDNKSSEEEDSSLATTSSGVEKDNNSSGVNTRQLLLHLPGAQDADFYRRPSLVCSSLEQLANKIRAGVHEVDGGTRDLSRPLMVSAGLESLAQKLRNGTIQPKVAKEYSSGEETRQTTGEEQETRTEKARQLVFLGLEELAAKLRGTKTSKNNSGESNSRSSFLRIAMDKDDCINKDTTTAVAAHRNSISSTLEELANRLRAGDIVAPKDSVSSDDVSDLGDVSACASSTSEDRADPEQSSAEHVVADATVQFISDAAITEWLRDESLCCSEVIDNSQREASQREEASRSTQEDGVGGPIVLRKSSIADQSSSSSFSQTPAVSKPGTAGSVGFINNGTSILNEGMIVIKEGDHCEAAATESEYTHYSFETGVHDSANTGAVESEKHQEASRQDSLVSSSKTDGAASQTDHGAAARTMQELFPAVHGLDEDLLSPRNVSDWRNLSKTIRERRLSIESSKSLLSESSEVRRDSRRRLDSKVGSGFVRPPEGSMELRRQLTDATEEETEPQEVLKTGARESLKDATCWMSTDESALRRALDRSKGKEQITEEDSFPQRVLQRSKGKEHPAVERLTGDDPTYDTIERPPLTRKRLIHGKKIILHPNMPDPVECDSLPEGVKLSNFEPEHVRDSLLQGTTDEDEICCSMEVTLNKNPVEEIRDKQDKINEKLESEMSARMQVGKKKGTSTAKENKEIGARGLNSPKFVPGDGFTGKGLALPVKKTTEKKTKSLVKSACTTGDIRIMAQKSLEQETTELDEIAVKCRGRDMQRPCEMLWQQDLTKVGQYIDQNPPDMMASFSGGKKTISDTAMATCTTAMGNTTATMGTSNTTAIRGNTSATVASTTNPKKASPKKKFASTSPGRFRKSTSPPRDLPSRDADELPNATQLYTKVESKRSVMDEKSLVGDQKVYSFQLAAQMFYFLAQNDFNADDLTRKRYWRQAVFWASKSNDFELLVQIQEHQVCNASPLLDSIEGQMASPKKMHTISDKMSLMDESLTRGTFKFGRTQNRSTSAGQDKSTTSLHAKNNSKDRHCGKGRQGDTPHAWRQPKTEEVLHLHRPKVVLPYEEMRSFDRKKKLLRLEQDPCHFMNSFEKLRGEKAELQWFLKTYEANLYMDSKYFSGYANKMRKAKELHKQRELQTTSVLAKPAAGASTLRSVKSTGTQSQKSNTTIPNSMAEAKLEEVEDGSMGSESRVLSKAPQVLVGGTSLNSRSSILPAAQVVEDGLRSHSMTSTKTASGGRKSIIAVSNSICVVADEFHHANRAANPREEESSTALLAHKIQTKQGHVSKSVQVFKEFQEDHMMKRRTSSEGDGGGAAGGRRGSIQEMLGAEEEIPLLKRRGSIEQVFDERDRRQAEKDEKLNVRRKSMVGNDSTSSPSASKTVGRDIVHTLQELKHTLDLSKRKTGAIALGMDG